MNLFMEIVPNSEWRRCAAFWGFPKAAISNGSNGRKVSNRKNMKSYPKKYYKHT
jgi:hypothetical protein